MAFFFTFAIFSGYSIAQEDPDKDQADGLAQKVLDAPPSLLQGDTTLPDALYMRNDKGEPIFIPKIRYAEFERYLKERSGLGQVDLPTAIIDSIEVTGVVREGFAELKVGLSMSIPESTTALVRMPLRMHNMNWTGQPKTSGGKTNIVVAGSNEEGLTWWVEPDGSETYSLDLEAVVKTERSFSESSLRLELPESAVQIKLVVPGSDLNLQWLGATGEVFQTEVFNESTQAVVRGRGGIGTLIWRDQLSSRDLGAVEIDSTTRIVRSNDGKEYFGSSRLRIVSDNRVGPRELTIWLPENATWNPSAINGTSSYWTLDRWRAKEGAESGDKPSQTPKRLGSRQRLHLKLSDRSRNFVEDIPIDWTFALDDPTSSSFAITGIEVDGVQRHEGHLSIVMPTSTRFSWLPSSDYALAKQSPANDAPDSIEYEFRFSRQPIRLQAVISEADVQTRWRPDYLVTFDQDALRLQGVLTFPNDPSQLIGTKIVGGAWQLDMAVWDKSGELIRTEIEDGNTLRFLPESLIAAEEVADDNRVSALAPIAIRFSGYQPLPVEDVQRVVFQLPQISTSIKGKRKVERGSGSLVIDHGTWQVNSSETRVMGLARSSESPPSLRTLLSELPASDLQIFRFQSSGQEAKWTGRIQRLSRVVSASMNTNLIVHSDEWRCLRQWKIQSTGPALERLSLRVPAAWLDFEEETGTDVVSDRVKVSSDGVSLEMKVIQKSPDGWATIESIRNNWPDTFDLIIAYRESIGDGVNEALQSAPNDTRSMRMFLPKLDIQPSLQIFDVHSTILAGPGLLCKVPQAAASPILCTSQDGLTEIPLSEASDAIDIEITPWVSSKEDIVEIQRVWLQTVMNAEQRRDRCVMRILSKQSSLSFKLPPGWSETSTSILVNNRKQALEPGVENGVYRLVLPTVEATTASIIPILNEVRPANSLSTEPKPIVIEFWNWSSQTDYWSKLVNAELPTILSSSGAAPLVWQVVLPSNEHLWTSTGTLLSDQRWEWRNLGWRRKPNLTQEQAEMEFGASVQPAIASQTNQYVFRSIGTVGNDRETPIGSIRVIPRFVLWLPVATVVLLLTALWPRMGVFRNPWPLLAVVVFLGLLSMTAPDMTILLVQAAVASLLVVALVKIVGWASRQRVHRRSVFVNRTLPAPPVRPINRTNIEESIDVQAKKDELGNLSTPSTHAMEANLPSPVTEARS